MKKKEGGKWRQEREKGKKGTMKRKDRKVNQHISNQIVYGETLVDFQCQYLQWSHGIGLMAILPQKLIFRSGILFAKMWTKLYDTKYTKYEIYKIVSFVNN